MKGLVVTEDELDPDEVLRYGRVFHMPDSPMPMTVNAWRKRMLDRWDPIFGDMGLCYVYSNGDLTIPLCCLHTCH